MDLDVDEAAVRAHRRYAAPPLPSSATPFEGSIPPLTDSFFSPEGMPVRSSPYSKTSIGAPVIPYLPDQCFPNHRPESALDWAIWRRFTSRQTNPRRWFWNTRANKSGFLTHSSIAIHHESAMELHALHGPSNSTQCNTRRRTRMAENTPGLINQIENYIPDIRPPPPLPLLINQTALVSDSSFKRNACRTANGSAQNFCLIPIRMHR